MLEQLYSEPAIMSIAPSMQSVPAMPSYMDLAQFDANALFDWE